MFEELKSSRGSEPVLGEIPVRPHGCVVLASWLLTAEVISTLTLSGRREQSERRSAGARGWTAVYRRSPWSCESNRGGHRHATCREGPSRFARRGPRSAG